MSKKKITGYLKGLVAREKRKAPHLGVRQLSALLKKEHDISLSKSAIHKILKNKGIKESKGRKQAALAYKQRGVEYCGLMLLRALDHQIGLFDYLTDSLKSNFPALGKDLLKKLIILKSFSAYINDDFDKSIERAGFLRLADIEHLRRAKAEYFSKKIAEIQPVVDLEPLKNELRLVSTIKFYFNNGYKGHCDAKMSTLWPGLCDKDYFFLPLRAAAGLIEEMLSDKLLTIGYSHDLDYLSPLVFDFVKAVSSGLNKVQFLDSAGRVLRERKVLLLKVSLCLGYPASVISKGLVFLRKPKRFKRFAWDELDEFFSTQILTRFVQIKGKQALILNNVLIKRSENSKPAWGILTTGNLNPKKASLADFLKHYLYLWPYLDIGFSRDLKNSAVYTKRTNEYLSKILPKKIIFKEDRDFSRISQILSVIFKELIYGWEPKRSSGDFTIAKEYIRIFFRKLPQEAKIAFNKGYYQINQRKAFIAG